jgi:hypothetical protein
MKFHGYYDEYEYTIYNEVGEEVYRECWQKKRAANGWGVNTWIAG